MWQRHSDLGIPSHHAIRDTCTQLLPLVEMYCKWELQEDCSDLLALMLRFDSETELESHELGRSLLFMIRNDGCGLDVPPRIVPHAVRPNSFNVVRERLQTAALAIQELRSQVCSLPCIPITTRLSTFFAMLPTFAIHVMVPFTTTQQPTTNAQMPLMLTSIQHFNTSQCFF